MTTQPNNRPAHAQAGAEQELIPKRFQHAAAVAVLVLSLIVFFNEIIFGGKMFLSADSLASHSFDTFLKDAEAQGVFPLWNPYIFCGMPGYGSLTVTGNRWFDLSTLLFKSANGLVGSLLNDGTGWVLVYYMIFAAGMYLLALSKFQHKVVALMTALAATFSTYIIIWVMTGHNTKIMVMAFFPFIFYAVEQLRMRFNLLHALLLALLVHFAFTNTHVQMIFYIYLALGVYFIFFLVRSLVTKEDWKGISRAGLIFVLASALAFAMDSDRYLSVLEYNPHSIRGSNPIAQAQTDLTSKNVEGGLDYEYATAWSLGPGEMMTFFIPSWYGFGSVEYRGQLTNNQPYREIWYFGPQGWTHAPQYMGLVVVVLALVGAWRNRKEPFVQYLCIMIVFSLLIAFGKEFSFVYDLMYRYFPTFNKFRVPSMILVLVQILVPILAGYGLLSLMSSRGQAMSPLSAKKWKYLLGGLAALFAVSLALPSVVRVMYGIFTPQQVIANKFAGQTPNVINELYNFYVGMVVTDVYVGALVLLVAFGSIYLYLRKSLSLMTFSVIILVVVVADLWRVDYKPMETQPAQDLQRYFTPPDYASFLQQDSTSFRVLQMVNGQVQYDNTLAYWRLQNAYGYQGAKMRAYQDMVDVAGLQNPLVWNMMNVKYIISNQPDTLAPLLLVYNGAQMKVYHNTGNLPRAYFVNRYEVASGKEILDKIAAQAFDPRDVAYMMDDPNIRVEPPQPGARAEWVRSGIQDLEVKVTASGNNLLVLSETYYPAGWKAYIDGNPTEIYRVNYLFRGVVVPPGVHTLTMKLEPSGFYLGKNISLVVNVLILGALGFTGFTRFRKKKSGEAASSTHNR
ncbi:MAG TPA: YfhO family protein [Bacteroidota bacterium]